MYAQNISKVQILSLTLFAVARLLLGPFSFQVKIFQNNRQLFLLRQTANFDKHNKVMQKNPKSISKLSQICLKVVSKLSQSYIRGVPDLTQSCLKIVPVCLKVFSKLSQSCLISKVVQIMVSWHPCYEEMDRN